MNKSAKKVSVLLFITVLCALGYSMYEWYSYKHKYNELQRELERSPMALETLSPTDCLVISGDNNAYSKCNVENFKMMSGYNDRQFSHRDYLLYCYIFAIRDGNSSAASEFVSYYLNEVDNGIIAVDTAMMREIERLSLQALCDTSAYGDALTKFLVAEWLTEIYNGTFIEDFKDSLRYRQYCDSVSKYAKQF